jgi:hypothetical protein
MKGPPYRLVGFVVWKAGRWYLRQRLPRLRSLALKGLAGGGALAGAVVLARRVMG